MDDTYKKRAGTAGISGHLYETKLITLLEFRLLHDATVQQFHLASNIDAIGDFDDVCVKIKIRGVDRPILAFLQAKHKDDDDTFLKYDLIKHYHYSFLKVNQKFKATQTRNALFDGNFDDMDWLFILYTNAKYYDDFNSKEGEQLNSNNKMVNHRARRHYKTQFSDTLNNLLATGDKVPHGVQLDYSKDDVQYVSWALVEEEIITLAEHFSKFLNSKGNQSMNILNDEYIARYHVMLTNSIVYIFDEKPEADRPSDNKDWRWLTFRSDFFYSDDNIINIFRNKIYELVVKNQGNTKKNKTKESLQAPTPTDATIDQLISVFLSAPSATTLCPLIGTHITNVNDTLRFAVERPDSDRKKLEHIQISTAVINEATALAAARNIMWSLKLKVPLHFGNFDLTITGSSKKVEKRLTHLTNAFVDLCKTFIIRDLHRIVTIDDSLGEGLLSCNGGIGGAVGNLLIHDEDTKLLKFNQNISDLPNNARRLMDSLLSNNEIGDLHLYRFRVKALQFPKLVFDCSEAAKGILSKLVIYEQQSNHHEVEHLIKCLMKHRHSTNNLHNLSVSSDIIFMYYHHEIQKWWMSQKAGSYLTKQNSIYRDVNSTIVLEPQMSALQVMFSMSKIKYFGYNFSQESTECLKQLEHCPRTVVVSDVITMTAVKVAQCLNNKYVIIDLECILNLPTDRLVALNTELRNTERVIIFVCENIHNGRTVHRILDQFADATEEKQIIVITSDMFVETVQDYFTCAELLNDSNWNLNDLSLESQQKAIENTNVIFQGQEVSLDLLVGDTSLEFIKGAVLDKVIRNETIVLDETLSDEKYEQIKYLYVERRIGRRDGNVASNSDEPSKDCVDGLLVRTLHDIKEDAVLITAKPGMGKSTLLTHLSLNTKEEDKTIWILRINLLNHSKVFYKWQEHKTVIDITETMKFLCRVVLKNNEVPIHLTEIESKFYAADIQGDAWCTFKLNMFLQSFNKRKIIILFDGFDEICPHYKDVVLSLLNVIGHLQHINKLWVTSRPYNKILPDLELLLGKPYEIEYMNDTEQKIFLDKFWAEKFTDIKLNDFQLGYLKFLQEYLPKIPSGELWKFHFNLTNKLNLNKSVPGIDSSEPPTTNYVKEPKPTKSKKIGNEFFGTPLLLYLVADYIADKIQDKEACTEYNLDINIFTIYEKCVETKLKRILFEDKNKMDVYNPDIMTRYEKDLAECISVHKKLGAHALFGSPLFSRQGMISDKYINDDMSPFKEGEFEYDATINKIKEGVEKTGFVTHITTDNIPIFIHRTFAEYFATEYFFDIFKSDKFELVNKAFLYTILNDYVTANHDLWILKCNTMKKELEIIQNYIPCIIREYFEMLHDGEYQRSVFFSNFGSPKFSSFFLQNK